MSTSNWQSSVKKSKYHFDWNRHEAAGYDYRWLSRFVGDWTEQLETVKKLSEPKTWATRGKTYHPDDPQLESEENDLINSGMSKDTIIFRKYFEFDGAFKNMLDAIGLVNNKQAFHIQYPGEMLNLHIDKQYEMNDDPNQVARFFIFLEDWKPGHFVQMGTSFIQWRAGDLIWFDWKNIPHATANAGWEPRCLIQVTGTISDKTKDIMCGMYTELQI